MQQLFDCLEHPQDDRTKAVRQGEAAQKQLLFNLNADERLLLQFLHAAFLSKQLLPPEPPS
eukprot:4291064-Amphidinium_carterae.1